MRQKSDHSSNVSVDVLEALQDQAKRQIIKELRLRAKQERLLTKAAAASPTLGPVVSPASDTSHPND